MCYACAYMGNSRKGGVLLMNQSNQSVVFMRDRGRVTIPASLREKYAFKEGSELILAEEEGRLVLYPSREQRVEEFL